MLNPISKIPSIHENVPTAKSPLKHRMHEKLFIEIIKMIKELYSEGTMQYNFNSKD